MIAARILIASVAGAALAAGCAGESSPEPAVAAEPRTIELPVAAQDGSGPSPWIFEVPVPAGWKVVTEEDYPVAALVRPFAKGCELLVNVYAEPAPGTFPLAKVLKKASAVERGHRSVAAGGQRFRVTYRLGQIGGLAFGGGATGPGGFAALRFAPEREGGPKLTLTAQGGTDGNCFSVSLKRAPALVVRAIRPIATKSKLKYEG